MIEQVALKGMSMVSVIGEIRMFKCLNKDLILYYRQIFAHI